ncbi:hypothetical protein GCM10010441_17970 [Kitasatospora paracochleata]|uniref:F0F1-type ATP synthase membrane subunit c/vacuolar-type H+-ATPase subunit K n=1 Tax=Kitasatospora paracochleata TaxID=58354 RepID=A0ABT1JBW7_9ACTN|nr:hypothetical protein [Kitasatospora paracochleata]MCP2314171.1 F0F1-type ATP synthase membrane subunit c/vacuolar-type H+-ATPase subunit K [Kitasatospora paracochleata]
MQLPHALAHGALALGTLGAGYTLTIAAVALTAIAARTPERRRDARHVRAVLLPRRRR